MGRNWYGSINNRIEEGHNYESDKKIKVGTDITTYFWSDRQCKYVTKVIDQKHIFVKDYYVCADRSKPAGIGHQNWRYFKTAREEAEYLNGGHPENIDGKEIRGEQENATESPEEEWAFRYGHWNRVIRFDKALAEKIEEKTGRRGFFPKTEKEKEAFEAGKEVVRYDRIREGISFGVRDYFFDWDF